MKRKNWYKDVILTEHFLDLVVCINIAIQFKLIGLAKASKIITFLTIISFVIRFIFTASSIAKKEKNERNYNNTGFKQPISIVFITRETREKEIESYFE